MTEINKEHEKGINADINLLLQNENIFKIPDIYKIDYRGKTHEEQKQMIKDFIKKYSKKDEKKEKKKEKKFDDVIEFGEVRFKEVDKGDGEIEYREGKKPKSCGYFYRLNSKEIFSRECK